MSFGEGIDIEWLRDRVGKRKIFLVFGTVVLRDEYGRFLGIFCNIWTKAALFANLVLMNRRAAALIFIPFFLFTIGTVGYMIIEGWNVADAFYMTAITLTTVGFSEVRPLTTNGRFLTVALLVFGVAFIAYGLEYLLTANLGESWRNRRMMQTIESLENHVIVCGYGRVGQSAVASLQNGKRQVLIIEKEPEKIPMLGKNSHLFLKGDATKDEVLQQANIDQAWGMLVCTGDDAGNLFIVLSARALNANLYIVTRSIGAENERKMRRAGANRVVSPHQIGGRHMANIIERPHVTDFFDVVTLDGGIEIWVEELVIEEMSPLVSKTVGEANIRQETGVTIIALRRENYSSIPDPHTRLQPRDELIVLGTREQLAQLKKLAAVAFGHL